MYAFVHLPGVHFSFVSYEEQSEATMQITLPLIN
jgi:hypothetical protein